MHLEVLEALANSNKPIQFSVNKLNHNNNKLVHLVVAVRLNIYFSFYNLITAISFFILLTMNSFYTGFGATPTPGAFGAQPAATGGAFGQQPQQQSAFGAAPAAGKNLFLYLNC